MSDETSLKKIFIISILLHLLLLLVPLNLIMKDTTSAMAEEVSEDEVDRMNFVFVETPDNAVESETEQVTPFISDKNLAASNRQAPENLPEDQPYQEGRSEVAAMTPEQMPSQMPPGVEDGSERQQEPREQREQQEQQSEQQQFDAMRQLEALSRLNPPKPEEKPIEPQQQQQAPLGGIARPQAPNAPRYDNRRSRVPVGSDFQLSTYNWDWAPYLKELKKRIESNIYPPPAFYMGLARGRTFLRFKIQQDGTMTDFELITYTGHESLKNTSVQAIDASAPFLPLPSDFPDDFLGITVGFFYNEFIH